MANYLPVLLVSVSTNAIPDDSSLSTQPRAQVDYLSHEWQEEDVWRSWRNMTRQKNEIANGIRLENASWRTWWKQRNKLKTVTPETLNWLKDSDVTWLYGPLHTAIDWAPPRKPDSGPFTSANSPSSPTIVELPSPINQLPKHKPILKHRSISELLTSDLPSSPLFSPVESENEADDPVEKSKAELNDIIEEPEQDTLVDESSNNARPKLMHTKSDSHVTRWGPSRLFRKESPPRLPNHNERGEGSSSSTAREGSNSPLRPPRPYSATNVNGFFFDAMGSGNAESSASHPSPPVSAPVNGASGAKRKHISFNTFVEQCIAIEKPKKASSGILTSGSIYPSAFGPWDGYDEGYDEDTEDGYVGSWANNEDSDTDSECDERTKTEEDEFNENNEFAVEDGYDEDEDDEDEDDGLLHMRASPTAATFRQVNARSHSKSSTRTSASASSNSTSSSSSCSSSTARRLQRRNSAPTRRRGSLGLVGAQAFGVLPSAPVHRVAFGSNDKDEKEVPMHVTIAPIAPTLLKTASPGSEEDEDDSYTSLGYDNGFGYGTARFGWWAGGGDAKGALADGQVRSHKREVDRAESPVELVYVPRVNSGYALGLRFDDPDSSRTYPSPLPLPSPRSASNWLGDNHETPSPGLVTVTPASPDRPAGLGLSLGGGSLRSDASGCTPPAVATGDAEEDPYDYFGGPDLGEDFSGVSTPRRSAWRRSDDEKAKQGEAAKKDGSVDDTSRASSSTSGLPAPSPATARIKGKERSTSRSRSRSRSRTPSPACFSPSSADTASSPSPPVASTFPPASASSAHLVAPRRCNSFDSRQTSATGSGPTLLSPPLRGRGALPQGASVGSTERGRSATRTSSSSFSDRERSRSQSHCHNSPLGSLSPDGGSAVYAAYASGRVDKGRDNERDKDRGRGGEERGRPRTERRLRQSVSPDEVGLARSPVGASRGRGGSSPLASSPLAAPPASLDATLMPETSSVPTSPTQTPAPPIMERCSASVSTTGSGTTSTVPPSSTSTTTPSPSLLTQSAPPKIAPSSLVSPSNSNAGLGIHCGAQGESEGGIVGRAANMVSSYLGLWHTGAGSGAAAA